MPQGSLARAFSTGGRGRPVHTRRASGTRGGCSRFRRSGWRAEAKLTRERWTLTTREEQVLDCVTQGFSNKEIGRQLELSEKTVKHYLSGLFDKLTGVSDAKTPERAALVEPIAFVDKTASADDLALIVSRIDAQHLRSGHQAARMQTHSATIT
jgi:DNA-binding CsgD family transcriptional regulator